MLRRFSAAPGSARRPVPTDAGRRAIAVVDFHEHTRGGHFGQWLRWFVSEFSARFDRVHVVTPSPGVTQSLFEGPGAPGNATFHRLPRPLSKRFDLEALRELDGAGGERLSAFVMWGYDVLELGPARAPGTVPWATLAGVSWLRRRPDAPSAALERKLLAVLGADPACRAFLQADEYMTDVEKAIWVPDLEDVATPDRRGPRAERIHDHAGGRFCIGAFGMLSGPRCVHELLHLARAQPEVRFVLAGKIHAKTVVPELRRLLEPGALPNVLVLPGFIPTDEELNDAIGAVDAVFIDGANYPVQSGIVCKALHLGLCVVTPRSNSWTFDFARRWRTGIVYDSRNEPIADAWERWKRDGGESRSRAASEAMRDPRNVAASFDRLAKVLAT